MNQSFHRFPHTPHLAWLGEGSPRADKVLSETDAINFLAHEIVVEEKIDGANLGLSTDNNGNLLAQNRGSWLTRDSAHTQFRSLWSWLAPRQDTLVDALWPDLILFGEWCAVVHSVYYNSLPDWFLGFDVFDRTVGQFWSIKRRNNLLNQLEIHTVPHLGYGKYTVENLVDLMTISRVGSSPMEGVYIRADSETFLKYRAKLVRPEFVQSIDTHWRNKRLRRNRLAHMEWN